MACESGVRICHDMIKLITETFHEGSEWSLENFIYFPLNNAVSCDVIEVFAPQFGVLIGFYEILFDDEVDTGGKFLACFY